MAYWETKVLAPTATPDRHNNQPTAFSGRREATMAPTVASITTSVLPNHHSKTVAFGWERLRTTRRALSAVSARVMVHSDQAIHGAARVLIPPTPRSRPVAPFVTTPLYSSTVSQPLRQPLRDGVINNSLRTSLVYRSVARQPVLHR